ncbi:hypothetical protein [Bifidobacterium vansinderenii]|uniref:Uncharacterized protein n=1 Tax=Bifidobacterium vansinderenii TaxID=1984871 RepID=A0A229VXN3_9BIFI|nr:hypothetical protein [Bifidobacterium vansinderenii]OXN00389.1 hypothetical protein Tam10B_1259 [Bifidobacterium vansinderenii]
MRLYHLDPLTNGVEPCREPDWVACRCGEHYATLREAVDASVAAGPVDWSRYSYRRKPKPRVRVTMGLQNLRGLVMRDAATRVERWVGDGHYRSVVAALGYAGFVPLDYAAGPSPTESILMDRLALHGPMACADLLEVLLRDAGPEASMLTRASARLMALTLRAAAHDQSSAAILSTYRLGSLWMDDADWNDRELRFRLSREGSLDAAPRTGVQRFAARAYAAQIAGYRAMLDPAARDPESNLMREALVNGDLPVLRAMGIIIPNTDRAIQRFAALDGSTLHPRTLERSEALVLLDYTSMAIRDDGTIDVDYDGPVTVATEPEHGPVTRTAAAAPGPTI